MRGFIQWIGSKGAWICSPFSDLPALPRQEKAELHAWCVLAGGLALILSRASAIELAGRLRSTQELHRLVRRRLGEGRRPNPGAGLVSEVMHEIEPMADPMTRSAAQACFNACLRHRKSDAPSQAPERSLFEGMTSTQWRQSSLQRSSRHGVDFDDIPTQLSPDVFGERSANLRKAVATARSTGFADLK